ncbi:MAG: DUF5915 domain-containing protein, partial [Longimicrobiales bacterium]
RVLCRLGRAAREQTGIRVRQPLRTLYAVTPADVALGDELLDVVRAELNVKDLHFLERATDLVHYRVEPNFRVLGPRLGPQMKAVAEAVRALPAERVAELRAGRDIELEAGGERVVVALSDVEVRQEARGDLAVESDEGYTVALDPAIDEPLRLEGLARELISRIQRLRKDAGLQVSDRIRVGIGAAGLVLEAAEAYGETIARETLARDFRAGVELEAADYVEVRDVELDHAPARIGLAKV